MRKIKGLRWYMIALVTLGTVLGYLTRNTVAAAAPTLMEELHITTQQYSYIIAAYSAAYTIMQPVAGYVLDILGTKIGYAFFAVAWAIFCGATALAGSWGGLALARGAVGAAEAAMIPAGLKASSEWFPAKERSIAVGYFNVGSSIGAMIAPPLVVWAIVMHSWQMAFIISGVLSFAWAMAWLVFYKHPRDQKKLSEEEREYIIGGQESQHQTNNGKKMSVWQILGTRQFWGIALPRFLAEPAWGTFNAWIPLFMFKVYGFNLHQSLSGALITLSSDVFGRNEVATANGLTGMAAWTASTMFALVVGALADTIGFSPLFAVLAIFDLMGAVVIWTVLKSKSADELAKESLGKPATQS